MLPRRFLALSLAALVLFALGLLALALPDPYQGPMLLLWRNSTDPGAPPALAGLNLLGSALYLSDAVGLVLLALALVMVWALALSWERRRRRRGWD